MAILKTYHQQKQLLLNENRKEKNGLNNKPHFGQKNFYYDNLTDSPKIIRFWDIFLTNIEVKYE
jgi:hypothetical protein